MATLHLNGQEVREIADLLSDIFSGNQKLSTQYVLSEGKLLSDRLPLRVRRAFHEFKLYEASDTLLIKGYPIDQNVIGPTPQRIPSVHEKACCTKEEVLHFLFAFRLGEIFTWSSIQNGNIVNEIVPIKDDEDKPISSGSRCGLDLHTEDAFHPLAGEYVGLLCLRNPGSDPLTIVHISDLRLDPVVRDVLFQSRFRIGVNMAHQIPDVTELSPILFGNVTYPYIRVNLNNIQVPLGDEEARFALDSLVAELRANSKRYDLVPGDFLYIDNFQVVHGREVFSPKYDGSDRWLKRIYITSDLRRSRALRDCPESRIIQMGKNQ